MASRGSLALASLRARRSFVLLWSALFVFSLLLQYATFAAPQRALGAAGLKAGTVQGFEVDGDPTSGNGASNPGAVPAALIDSANPLANGDDWIDGSSGSGVVDPPSPPDSVLIADPANSSTDNIFSGGAKELDTCTWGYTTGPVTPKDDFRHVMAYAKFVGASAFFYMGAERIVNNGDTHIDFELNKLPFTTFPGAPGVSKPNRSVGDLIIALEFSNGGSNPEVTVWRVKKVTDCKQGGQVAGQKVEVEDITTTAAVHSATNFVDLAPITWPGDSTATTLKSFFFAEAAIDLASLGITTACPGLSSGSIRSRAGGDISSSQLKDTVAPFPIDLNNCGTVTIVKDAVPDDPQDFAFSGSFGNFSLDDDNNATLPDRRTFTQVAPGTYTVTEGSVSGWKLTDLVCSNANSSGNLGARTATIQVEPNEDVTCTFTNTKLAKLIVEKQTSPDGAPGSFSFSGAVSGSIGDGGTIASGFLDPGAYTVTEADPAPPFDLGAITCDDTNSSGDVDTRTATFRLEAGEVVTCTFTNVQRGTVTIIKDAVPNDPQDFSFSGGLGSFTLDDDGSEAGTPSMMTFTNVVPGSYTVTEAAVSGWDLSGVECNGTGGSSGSRDGASAAITLTPGGSVTCTFTNTKRGTIIVDKVTDPSGDPTSFAFSLSGGPDSVSQSFNLTDAATPHNSGALKPGTYSVEETVPAGWDLTGASCSDGSNPAAIDLAPGETVTCTFTNTKRGTIVVDKVTDPSGDPTSFAFSLSGGPDSVSQSFNLTDAATPHNSGALKPGTYSVEETVPAGWDLTGASCSDGSNPAAIDLAPGETVTCTFTNTKRGTIIVEKQTNPDGDPATFSFTGDVAGTLGDGDQASASVAPGTYTSTEAVPAGWDLTAIDCSDSDSAGDLATATATFEVAPGETVTCTFTNTKRGTIVVDKVTDPSGDPTSFAFSLSGGPDSVSQSFNLTDAATPHNSGALKPGTYSVEETVPAGWDLTGASCSDGSNPAAIDLAPGETVTCTFTNTKRGTIIVEKQTSPDGASDEFTFTGDAAGTIADGGQIVVSNLKPGTYTSTEADPGSDWDLGAIVCNDTNSSGNVATRTATFQLDPGETVTCTFTNVQRGTITIIKNAVPDDPQDFSFTQTIDESGGFLLDDDADGTLSNTKTFEHVVAGDYSVTEAGVGGWDLTDLTCEATGGSTATRDGHSVDIHLTEGGSVTCVFTNTKRGSITIVKDAVPNDAQAFAFTGDLGDFSLVDDGTEGTNAQTFTNLVPGTYGVSETPVAGWDLTSAVCSDESDPAEIDLGPGEHVTCTFVNERPSISVTKTAGDAADGATFTTLAGPVTYTYVVTNSGPVALENVTVSDDNGTPSDTSDDFAATCPKTTLDAGESMTCSATVTVSADRTNTATVRGFSAQGTEVSDQDTAIVVVRVPSLVIEKAFTGNTEGTDTILGVPKAAEGDTLTYTLTYTLTNGPVTGAVITDTLPAGLTYVTGSAAGNDEFSFTSFDSTTGTLRWDAASATKSGSVTYQVVVAAGAAALSQPLVNTAVIDSNETNPDDDTAAVAVAPPPLAETATPRITPPPTDTADLPATNPGSMLMIALLVIAAIALLVGLLTPAPARATRRDRRR
jgi:fimbrial isopeptide formation D2 family protein